LTDWDDDDPATAQQTSKHDKVVILKHMFTLAELDEDPAAILDIKEDIREECSKLGQVTNVVLFDKEQAGVASVRFSTVDSALACVQVMNGRHFGGQTIEAHIATGKERFKKSSDASYLDDNEGEEKARLDGFGSWLEQQEG
jgi:HIV Tat-specific factor 1